MLHVSYSSKNLGRVWLSRLWLLVSLNSRRLRRTRGRWGIDRVIVVGSNADFSSSEIAGITTQSSGLQSAGIEVQLAQASADAVLSIRSHFPEHPLCRLNSLTTQVLASLLPIHLFYRAALLMPMGRRRYSRLSILIH